MSEQVSVPMIHIRVKEANQYERKAKSQKKQRFYGNGEWSCVACGLSYSSVEARGIGLRPDCGCPNCGGILRYEEV